MFQKEKDYGYRCQTMQLKVLSTWLIYSEIENELALMTV
jgi:hypothetical protein